jgi:hypothetical protein
MVYNSVYMNRRGWTIQEESVLAEKCEEGKSNYKAIGELLNRTGDSCQLKARRIGANNLYKSGKRYEVNKDFWKPGPISAYWAGFSAADASISKSSLNCYAYRLEISTKDESHLYKLKEDCNFTGPIKRSLRRGQYLHSRVLVSEPRWTEDLAKYWNIVPNKTKRLAPPNLESEYLKFCYLIGYLDGDGTIFFDKKRNRLAMKFLSDSSHIIDWCHDLIFTKFANAQLRNRVNRPRLSTGGYPSFDINGIRAAVVFDNLNKFDLPKLERKWGNPDVLNFVNDCKTKHSDLFF